ncbi:hypothetical protein KP509_18G072900 [Ceratopteris richardii]|nr:hypothetical protein KP509_18G072900 [Ceratopteris richardii]
MFGQMPAWDVVSWTSIIMAFSQNGHNREALNLFFEMSMMGFVPNQITFLCSLEACISLSSLFQGQYVHIEIVKFGLEKDRILGTATISLYGKCGCLQDALKVFRAIDDHDIASWNAAIVALVHCGKPGNVRDVIYSMLVEGFNADHVTIVSALDACRSFNEGLDMHVVVIYFGLEQNMMINNTLINIYGKYAHLPDSLYVFQKMPCYTLISWNAMLTAFADNLHSKEAILMFFDMQRGGFIPDNISFLAALKGCTNLANLGLGHLLHSFLIESGYDLDIAISNTIIAMYGCCGSIDDAEIMFFKLSNRNLVTWSSMIGIYCHEHKGEEALVLFYQMHLDGFNVNEVILTSALEACGIVGAYEQGLLIHAYLVEMGLLECIVLENTLLSFYGKCGDTDNSWATFNRMNEHDLISWTNLIIGFYLGGHSKRAIDILCSMQLNGYMPDKTSLLCIFSAFNHDGEVDLSKHFFAILMREFFITDSRGYFLCMVDLLGRAGLLDEAEVLVNEAPAEIVSQATLCLLSACKIHGDFERIARVADLISDVDLDIPSLSIMLFNLSKGRHNKPTLCK